MKKIVASVTAMALVLASAGFAQAGPMTSPFGPSAYDDPDAPFMGGGQVYQQPGYAPPPPQPQGYYGSPPQQGGYDGCNDRSNEVVGTIVGGIIGGIIGNQFGRGRGRTGATIAGVVFGGLAGNAISRNRWCNNVRADAYYYNTAYYDAFDEPYYGRQYQWRNEYNGNYGYVTPIRETYYQGYQDCREFEQVIYINGQAQTGRGVACAQPDGTWRIVS